MTVSFTNGDPEGGLSPPHSGFSPFSELWKHAWASNADHDRERFSLSRPFQLFQIYYLFQVPLDLKRNNQLNKTKSLRTETLRPQTDGLIWCRCKPHHALMVKSIILKDRYSIHLAEGDVNCTSVFAAFMSLSSNFSAKIQWVFTDWELKDQWGAGSFQLLLLVWCKVMSSYIFLS